MFTTFTLSSRKASTDDDCPRGVKLSEAGSYLLVSPSNDQYLNKLRPYVEK